MWLYTAPNHKVIGNFNERLKTACKWSLDKIKLKQKVHKSKPIFFQYDPPKLAQIEP